MLSSVLSLSQVRSFYPCSACHRGLDAFTNFLPLDWDFSNTSASGSSLPTAETSTTTEQNMLLYSDASFMDPWSQSGSPDINASNLSDSFSLSFVDDFIWESSSSTSASNDSLFLFDSDLPHSAASSSGSMHDYVSNHSPTISNNLQDTVPSSCLVYTSSTCCCSSGGC